MEPEPQAAGTFCWNWSRKLVSFPAPDLDPDSKLVPVPVILKNIREQVYLIGLPRDKLKLDVQDFKPPLFR
jgi:hypothetical protein